MMVSGDGALTDPGGILDSTDPELRNVWNYITGVYTRTELRIYADGIQRAVSPCMETSIYPSAEDVIIGAWDGRAVCHFQGILNEVRLSA